MKHLLAAGVLLVALSGAAWGASAPAKSPFVGTWTLVSEGATANDRRNYNMVVSESGGKYTVTLRELPNAGAAPGAAPGPTATISNVVVKGDTLTLHVTWRQGDQIVGAADYSLSHSGNKLTGTSKRAPPPPPERRITATRQ